MQANFAARCSWCFRTFAAFVFAALTLFFAPIAHAQTTVNYTTQTGNFNSLLTERNNNPPYAGTYNNGATELASIS